MSMMWIDSPSNSHGTPSILTLIVSWVSPCGDGRWWSLWLLSVSSFFCISPLSRIFPLILILHGQSDIISHIIWIKNKGQCAVWGTDYMFVLYNLYVCIKACKRSKKGKKHLCTSLFFVSCSHSESLLLTWVTAGEQFYENVELMKIKTKNAHKRNPSVCYYRVSAGCLIGLKCIQF